MGKLLDRSTLLLIVGAVILLAYIESKGGIRAFTASRSWDRKASIAVPDSPDATDPNPNGPSFPSPDGMALFANPIAAAEGAEGTIIAPMSATAGGAIRIGPDAAADPAYAARLYRDPDKGLLFVALPERIGKGGPNPTQAATAQVPSIVPNVMDYYRSFFGPKAQPKSFPVSF